MKTSTLNILLLEDNPDDRALIRREIDRELPGSTTIEILDAAGFDERLDSDQFDVVVTDYQLRWTDGLKALHRIKERYPEVPVIMFTNTGTEEVAVEALKSGLDDYIVKKPSQYPRVPLAIRSAMDRAEHRRRAEQSEREVRELNVRLGRAMRETHHRVKNSLQAVIALLDMQVMRQRDGMVRVEDIRSIEQHIRALAAIHDLLTAQGETDPGVNSVSLKAALERLIPMLEGMMGRQMTLSAEEIRASVSAGAAVSLIANELVANAVKHGDGPISVSLRRTGGNAELAVEDGGPGFPTEFEPDEMETAGLELVRSLAEWDLQGSVRFENRKDGGGCVTVTFPAG